MTPVAGPKNSSWNLHDHINTHTPLTTCEYEINFLSLILEQVWLAFATLKISGERKGFLQGNAH